MSSLHEYPALLARVAASASEAEEHRAAEEFVGVLRSQGARSRHSVSLPCS